MNARTRAGSVVVVAIAAFTLLVPAGLASGPTGRTLTADDLCGAQCHDILPPGQNGNITFTELLLFQLLGVRPAHSSDQIDRYEKLVWGYTGLTDSQITSFFNSASFGVPSDQVESVLRPRSDVTIVRDKATGVPHITGTTRSGTIFGAGFAGAQDRLFLMDVMRHVGRGQLTPFAGGAAGNQEFEQQQWRIAPYTEADLQRQFDRLDDLYGTEGSRLQQDIRDYVDGVNAYIARARLTLSLPGEYTAIGKPAGPDRWQPTDLVATASLVGGIFGGGGGREVVSAIALVEAQAKYGAERGTEVWRAFRSADDPEAVTTVHDGTTFPNGRTSPAAGTVLPDRGSVAAEPVVYAATASVTAREGTVPRADTGKRAKSKAEVGKGMLDGGILPEGLYDSAGRGMSNALLVSGQHTASGHPVAVFGPQTAYFAPQLLLLQELSGPGIQARGAAFAGVNMGVLLGRGVDYAWSATSAGQDITDTYAVDLCTTDGSAPTLGSDHYRFRGQCLPMEKLERHNAWTPSLADSTPAGSYTLRTHRTKLGLVTSRATVGGRPVAFTSLRSTYFHELDSGIGFSRFNAPDQIHSPQEFQQAAATIGYAFNWFYADAGHIAYFNSGNNPVRPDGADPNLPTLADQRYEWAGWNPDTNDATYQPFAEHPQVIDQDFLSSWNNKQAPGYQAADGNFSFGAVHRGDLLADRIDALIGAGPVTRSGLVSAMEEAGLADLRGEDVLPLLLDVLSTEPIDDPELAAAVAKLRAWSAAGALRTTAGPGATAYEHSEAIALLDAWWPLLVRAEFEPALGGPLYQALTSVEPVDERPSHQGSAFQHGWGGYVSKDLRTLLGRPVEGGLAQPYCGGGDLAACRQGLLDSLAAALDVPASQTYPADADCAAGDQVCHDQVIHQPVGGVTQRRIAWVNRPTYQQVVEFAAHR
ncbi:penicillin acylase family protein [Flindersiella endophytica]